MCRQVLQHSSAHACHTTNKGNMLCCRHTHKAGHLGWAGREAQAQAQATAHQAPGAMGTHHHLTTPTHMHTDRDKKVGERHGSCGFENRAGFAM